MRLESMKNIGKTLAEQLRLVGIEDDEMLIRLGSIEAAKRLGLSAPTCANKLYALEGAILNIRWHDMDPNDRKQLYQRMQDEINIRDKK